MSILFNPQAWGRILQVAFISLLMAVGLAEGSTPASGRVALYAAVGAELTQYTVDIENGTLSKHGSVTLPDNVQYAWPHPSRQYLYVGWSNGAGADHHGVSAFRIDPATGALHLHGNPVALPARPVHITVDIPGTHLLVAFNDPSGLTVNRIEADGRIGALVKQPAPLDFGIYAHQVRVDPSNKMVILTTRGNGPAGGKPEDPGALKILSYNDGLLTSRASIAPGGGFGFQPRHVDFSGPWIFVSLERQNKLEVYKKLTADTISREPLFIKDSLSDPGKAHSGQAAGTVHVHPNGRFVYQANRAGAASGQNTVAVYAINRNTGEPTLIQNIDTRGLEPRTFAIDPSGQILVAANQNAPASLAVFRISGDGKLDFLRKYAVETAGGKNLFWAGLVSLP